MPHDHPGGIAPFGRYRGAWFKDSEGNILGAEDGLTCSCSSPPAA